MYGYLSASGRFALMTQPPKHTALLFDFEHPADLVTLGPTPSIMRGTVSPEGRFVATDTWGGSGVKIWEVATRQALRDEMLRNLPPSSTELLFSPEGRWLAIRGEDNIPQIEITGG